MVKILPPKWTLVYPRGTDEGDDEQEFFLALTRSTKWQWRSTAALAEEAGLTKERTEEIIIKYLQKGMIFQNPANDDQWGYWERVPEELPNAPISLSELDHETRIHREMFE